MNYEKQGRVSLDRFRKVNPKAIRVTQEELARTEYFDPGEKFPLVILPNIEGLNPASWASSNRDFIESNLLAHGGILFRDFPLDSIAAFDAFAKAISPDLLEYRERAAPRTEVSKNIFTSTEFPPDQSIPLHHEMSYSHNWPTKIWFFCVQPAQSGGSTPIANDRKVFNQIDPRIRDQFMRRKVMYVRNYGEGVDLRWQEVFQTDDRSVVEEYCRKSHTEVEWRSGDRLRTRQIRQAVARHPKTADLVWFNHAHMFHMSNLPAAVRESLLEEFKDDELPRNAFYGDGSPIDDDVLDEIREVYRNASVYFLWKKGDVLMLDNFLASHGRDSFVGPRKILVAMAEMYTNPDL